MIRVLLVDDSPTVREILKRALSAATDIQVVGEAPDPYAAREQIAELRPDLITLDMEMPRMDGLSFLRKLMEHHPLPVVVLSSLTERGGELAQEALAAGAIEVLQKPTSSQALAEVAYELVSVIRGAVRTFHRRADSESDAPLLLSEVHPRAVVAVGASTGGTVAIEKLLRRLPASMPPMVIVQHMPPVFTRAFALRLSKVSRLEVKEAAGGERLEAGTVLIAPGAAHLTVRRVDGRLKADVRSGPRVSGHCPSVDVLFRSLAQAAGADGVGVLLTGMGVDGAQGMKELADAGAYTFAQDEASCVVFGMPKAAVDLGGVHELVGLDRLAARVVSHLERRARKLAPASPEAV